MLVDVAHGSRDVLAVAAAHHDAIEGHFDVSF
jgi:hypothetical protein